MTDDEREFDLVSEIVTKLRMGGPNAAEITDEAADTIDRLRTALAASEAKLEKARQALKPFAEAGRDYMMPEPCDMPDAPIMWSPTLRQIRFAATTLKDIA